MSGLFIKNDKYGKNDGLYFRLAHRLKFPIKDHTGRISGFSGRVIDDMEPKYKNTPETDVFKKRDILFGFDKAASSGHNYLVLCEGQMDVISMHQAGFKNAVASLGTSLTKTQVELIKNFTDLVIILYDTDAAGIKATKRAIHMLKDNGVNVYVNNTLPCKDPDEFIRKYGTTVFKEKLLKPLTYLEYEISSAKSEDGEYNYSEICSLLLKESDKIAVVKAIKKIAKKEKSRWQLLFSLKGKFKILHLYGRSSPGFAMYIL